MEYPMALDIMEDLRAIAERTGQPLVTVAPRAHDFLDEEVSLDEDAPSDENARTYRAFIQGGEEGVAFDLFYGEQDLT